MNLDNPHDAELAPSPLPPAAQWAAIGIFVAGVVISGGYAVFEYWRRATFLPVSYTHLTLPTSDLV